MGAIFGTIFVMSKKGLKISHNCLKMTVMMIRWVGVIRGCVSANRCIFWQKKRPTLAFNLELRVKFWFKNVA